MLIEMGSIETETRLSVPSDDMLFKADTRMQYEVLRLASFDKWPIWAVKRPMELAKNGFYYYGHGDQVKCFFCGGQIGNWSVNDGIFEEHLKQFPYCRLVQNIAGDNRQMENFSITGDSLEVITIFGKGKNKGGARDGTDTRSLEKEFNKSGETEGIQEANELLKLMEAMPGGKKTYLLENSDHKEVSHDAYSPVNLDPNLLRYENYRRQTFEDQWPENCLISPVELAKAGFYYIGPEDTVRCTFCKGRLRNWAATDNPMFEHRRHFSHCPFVQGIDVGNVPAEHTKIESQQRQIKKQGPSECLGVITDRPKHPEYAIETARLTSFKNWPKSSVIEPKDLVKAGFFYIGYSDNVRCFFCGGGLQNWEPGDDPWSEHAVWFPRCGFMKLTNGEEFIKEVCHKASENAGARQTSVGTSNTGEKIPLAQQQIDAWMNKPDIKTVLDLGFSSGLVRSVLQERLKTTGEAFPSLDALLDAVLNVKGNSLAAASEPSSSTKNHGKRKNKRQKKTREQNNEVVSPSENNKLRESQKEGGSDDENEKQELTQLAKLYEHLREERTCKICMDAESSVVFLPCGHVACCSNCAPALRTCPICRSSIKGSVRVHFP